jgi:hypothetical protein
MEIMENFILKDLDYKDMEILEEMLILEIILYNNILV